jgi:hypothetical protein
MFNKGHSVNLNKKDLPSLDHRYAKRLYNLIIHTNTAFISMLKHKTCLILFVKTNEKKKIVKIQTLLSNKQQFRLGSAS